MASSGSPLEVRQLPGETEHEDPIDGARSFVLKPRREIAERVEHVCRARPANDGANFPAPRRTGGWSAGSFRFWPGKQSARNKRPFCRLILTLSPRKLFAHPGRLLVQGSR
jgi:hypothetical protein